MKPPEKSGYETSFLYSRRPAAVSEYFATYTFTKIAMAVHRGVKHRKDPSPLTKEAADR